MKAAFPLPDPSISGQLPASTGNRTCGFDDFTSTVTAFYKGESQEKKLPGDWKEQRFLPGMAQ
jgi:hypothetical protein